jgi:hypothetical protein
VLQHHIFSFLDAFDISTSCSYQQGHWPICLSYIRTGSSDIDLGFSSLFLFQILTVSFLPSLYPISDASIMSISALKPRERQGQFIGVSDPRATPHLSRQVG